VATPANRPAPARAANGRKQLEAVKRQLDDPAIRRQGAPKRQEYTCDHGGGSEIARRIYRRHLLVWMLYPRAAIDPDRLIALENRRTDRTEKKKLGCAGQMPFDLCDGVLG